MSTGRCRLALGAAVSGLVMLAATVQPAVAAGKPPAVVTLRADQANVQVGTTDDLFITVAPPTARVAVQRLQGTKWVQVAALSYHSYGAYYYTVSAKALATRAYRTVVGATATTAKTISAPVTVHWVAKIPGLLPALTSSDANASAVFRLLTKAKLTTSLGPCFFVDIAGAVLSRGDMDVLIGVPGASCGGDAAEDFYRVRAGKVTGTASACGDCNTQDKNFAHLTGKYDNRIPTEFRAVAYNGGVRLWPGSLDSDRFGFQPGGFGPLTAGATFDQTTALLGLAGLQEYSDSAEDGPAPCRDTVLGSAGVPGVLVALYRWSGATPLVEVSVSIIGDAGEFVSSSYATDLGIAIGSSEAMVHKDYPHASRGTFQGLPTYLVHGPEGTGLGITVDSHTRTVVRIAAGTFAAVAGQGACH
jgi:hypothetical protein